MPRSSLIDNFYNLDPNWRQDIDAHRILLIEPSVFEKYPICENSMNFMLSLAKNISKMKVIVSEFKNLPIKRTARWNSGSSTHFAFGLLQLSTSWLYMQFVLFSILDAVISIGAG